MGVSHGTLSLSVCSRSSPAHCSEPRWPRLGLDFPSRWEHSRSLPSSCLHPTSECRAAQQVRWRAPVSYPVGTCCCHHPVARILCPHPPFPHPCCHPLPSPLPPIFPHPHSSVPCAGPHLDCSPSFPSPHFIPTALHHFPSLPVQPPGPPSALPPVHSLSPVPPLSPLSPLPSLSPITPLLPSPRSSTAPPSPLC